MDLRRRIIEFAGPASMEVTSHDRDSRRALAGQLAAGTPIYIAHTPNSTVAEVAEAACEVERDGFQAFPHLVARRIADQRELEQALARLQAGGIDRALLVAGDLRPPAGAFESTLDLLATGALEAHGIRTLGVAGHPEGHQRVEDPVLWQALQEKQRYAERTGAQLFIVTQFSFDADAVTGWVRRLDAEGIRLPVHVGIMGPATLATLIRYAKVCGVGASLQALLTNANTLKLMRNLKSSAEEMLLAMVVAREGALAARIVKPHFFAFGGVAQTARWLQSLRNGAFELDAERETLTVRR
jgi:methylenetetrahydrofolate reductase (NADPH)